jgi:hypothetical protein|tara:strand:- start:694 stop:852 length:159 start_codon:yes stop_codon:yes gene_type:complete
MIESRAQREQVATSKALVTNIGIGFMASTNRLISQLEIRFLNWKIDILIFEE